MNLLHVDIETSPNKVYVWGFFNQNVSINQIVESGSTICWAAKWHGKREVIFDSVHKSSPEKMLKRIHKLLDEADAVCHYNGKRFDIPTLNKEFVKHGFNPPSPYAQVDLLKTARKEFRFPSNKLDYISQELGIGQKIKHMGMELWHDCMEGDEKAWRLMERYNKQDVRLLERLYKRILPWISGHPNYSLFTASEKPLCRNCGSHKLQSRGVERTSTQIYRRFQCQECGKWQRGNKTIKPKGQAVTI